MKSIYLLIIGIAISTLSLAQVAGDYRSAASGNWNDPGKWQRYGNAGWVAASVSPSSNDSTVTIRASYTITVNSTVTADQVLVDSGANLIVSSGNLQIVDGSGIDLSVNGAFTFSGSFIDGAGLIQINSGGSFTWTNGNMRGSGTTNINAGATCTLSTGGASRIIQDTRTINNYGVCNWSSGSNSLLFGASVVFNNYGSFNINTNASFGTNGAPTAPQFINTPGGAFNKLDNSTTTLGGALSLVNQGTLSIVQGTLQLNESNATTKSGILSISSGATLSGTSTFNFTGPTITNNGTIVLANGLSMSGTAVQQINGMGSIDRLTLNNANGITLGGDQTITSGLIFTDGILYTGIYKLIIEPFFSINQSTGNSWVDGNLQRNYGGSGPLRFDVGDANGYAPIFVDLTLTAPGGITVKSIAGDHPQIGSSTIDSTKSINHHWNITNNGALFSNANITFNWNPGGLDAGIIPSNMRVAKYNGPVWTLLTASGANTYGITASGITSFSDFQIGEAVATTPAAALKFDGVNDFVGLPNALATAFTSPANNSITIEYWFKGTDLSSAVRFQDFNGYIVAGWSSPQQHIISTDGGTNGILVGAAATDGNWHHIAMTWKRNTINGFRSYLDGQLVDQRNAANVSLPLINSSAYLGSLFASYEFANGSLDEVRIWNRALPQTEIQANMNCEITTPQPGLLANYHFNQGVAGANNSTVTSLSDASGNGYNGILNNFAYTGTTSNWVAPGGVTTGNACATPPPTPAAALNFDGVNDYVTLPNALATAFTSLANNALTIEYWFKGSDISSAVRFQGANNNNNYIVAGYGSQRHIISSDGFTNGILVGAASTDGNWHHIAMTWERNTVNGFRSYLDGQIVDQRNSANVSLPPIDSAYLGSWLGTSEFMNGSLDEVRIWNRALPQAEIQANMNCEITTSQAGLLANYHFNQGVDGLNNSTVTSLSDASGNGYNGLLNNFANTGLTSNWVAPGGVVSGTSCLLCAAPPLITNCPTAITVCQDNPSGSCNVHFYPDTIASPVAIDFVDRLITYTNVSINGGTNSAVVAASSSVSLAYNLSVYFDYGTGYCPGCVVQSYVGIGGTNQTIQCEPNINNGYTSAPLVNFTAPSTPGIYYLTQSGTLDYFCQPQDFTNLPSDAIGVIVVGPTYPTATSNCSDVIITNDAPACFPVGQTLLTWTATDSTGNFSTCTQTVTVDPATVYYADADADGYGNPSNLIFACTQPTGYTLDSTDCNDSNANIHPLAFDINGNGIDEDCSGADAPCLNPDAPVLNTDTLNLCADQSATIYVAVGNLNSATSWMWSADSAGINVVATGDSFTVSPGPADTVIYYVLGLGGCVSNVPFTTFTVIKKPTPAPYIYTSDSVPLNPCTEDSVALQVADLINPSPVYTFYLWSTGNVTAAILTNNPKIYTITASYSNSCTGSASYELTSTANNLGVDDSICLGDEISLSAQGTNVLWSTGETTKTISVSPVASTTYYVSSDDINGCITSDTINVFIRPQLIPGSITINNATCGSNNASVTVTGVSGGTSAFGVYNYTLYSGCNFYQNNDGNFQGLASCGIWGLSITDDMGCGFDTTFNDILQFPTPIPTIIASGPLCIEGGDITLTAVNAANRALQFNGSDQQVLLDSGSSASTFTIEAWIKPTVQNSSYQTIYGNTKGLFLKDGKITWYDGSDILTGSTLLTLDEWHHIAISYNGANFTAYLNGQFDGSSDYNGPFPGLSLPYSNQLGIGGHNGDFFAGQMDEVRVWNTVLNQSAIEAYLNHELLYNHPSYANLQGYYQFNEGTAFNAADTSIYSYNGSLTDEAMWVYSTAPVDNFTNFSWQPNNQVTNTITVGVADTYSVSTISVDGCLGYVSFDVTSDTCIQAGYTPPDTGFVPNIIGPELTQLHLIDSVTNILITPANVNNNVYLVALDSVEIEIICNAGFRDSVLELMQTAPYGMTNFIDNGESEFILTGRILISNLDKLNLLTSIINYCRPYYPPVVSAIVNNTINTGVSYSKGDIAMRSNLARKVFKVDGTGIKVGVLSDSYNKLLGSPATTDVSNYDLPGANSTTPVHVLLDYPYGRRTDEGRAMLQIIHDVAPKAELAFRTGFVSAGNFAEGIIALADDSCDIIVDDITYITEPFFQDGLVARAVDSVAARGISYFSAAGNFSNKSYEGVFAPVDAPFGLTGKAHSFNGDTVNPDIYQHIGLDAGSYTIMLQWDDSIYSLGQLPGASNDLDIYLTDNAGNRLFGFNRRNNWGDPFEVLPFTVKGRSEANILIVRRWGSDNIPFKYIVFRGEMQIMEYNSSSSTIVGQANAKGAMAVGAVRYNRTPAFGINPPIIENFSSVGGGLTRGLARNKPDFCAPDGVNTTVAFGAPNIENDSFPNFFGSSAAAPHAAGVAALMLEAKNKFHSQIMPPSEVRSILKNTAKDMYATGYDVSSGSGFIQADSALANIAAPTPVALLLVPQDSLIVAGTDSMLVTVKGSYFNSQSIVQLRGVSLITTPISSTELSAHFPPFIGNPPITVYNPPITSSGLDGGTSDSIYFFNAVKKIITVTADNKTKKYGEKKPEYTATILVDGLTLDSIGLSAADLGLDTIYFDSPANNLSNTGIYFIHPSMDELDLNTSSGVGLNEAYEYDFTDGLLSITRLPLVISMKDTTITYGDKIDDLKLDYSYNDSLVDPVDKPSLLSSLEIDHDSQLADGLVLVDARNFVNGRAVNDTDLLNLSFLVSARSYVNARNYVNLNARNYVNVNVNSVNIDTTRLVDVDVECVFNYQIDSANGVLVNARNYVNVNARSYVNARNYVNGVATVNARNFVNGAPIANSNSINDNSNENVVIVIDEDDVNAPDSTIEELKSMSMITGTTVGTWAMVPGALLSNNFDISYALGRLTIVPDTLTIVANDTSTIYGQAPSLSAAIYGYNYEDDDSNVVVFQPVFTLSDTANNPVAINNFIYAGLYSIIPNGVVLVDTPNYVSQYVNGLLTVNQVSLLATVHDTARYYNTPNPVFRITYSGFINGDDENDITPPLASSVAVPTSPSGNYAINLTGGSSLNYSISNINGILTIVPDACTSLVYDFINGFYPPLIINDNNICTIDACDPVTGPSHTLVNIEDANVCTIDACDPLTGVSHLLINADDGDACTIDGCDSITGIFHHLLISNVGLITGTPIQCVAQTPGGGGYSIAAIPGVIYNWSAPAGMNIVAGQGTNAIYVTWTASGIHNGIHGQLCVAVTNACGSNQRCIFIDLQVSKPVQAGSISGPSKICPGDVATYSIASIKRADTYLWTLPSGVTLTNGIGTNIIQATVGSGYSGGSITVAGINSCGTGPVRSRTILINAPAIPGSISGATTGLCNLNGLIYSVAPVANALSYLWTSTAGASISGLDNGSSVIVNYGNINSGTVSVVAINGCGISAKRLVTVYGIPARPGIVTGSVTVCKGSTYPYSISTVPGTISYSWTVPGGTTFTGQGSKAIDVTYSGNTATSQVITVKATNACGISSARTLGNITIANCPRIAANDHNFNLSIYPNPAKDRLTISFNQEDEGSFIIEIVDVTGRIQFKEDNMGLQGFNSHDFNMGSLAKGVYFVTVKTSDIEQIVKLMVE